MAQSFKFEFVLYYWYIFPPKLMITSKYFINLDALLDMVRLVEAHLYLLHGSQILQLGVTDLLLQHQLLEVLRCVRLPL